MRLSLTRLRAAFVLLGAVLLLALALLARSALARLEHQRALRHEVVAERIFDELERELTAYLAIESERPSAAYDAEGSDVGAWARFVVGYFKVEEGYRIVSREQLERGRVERIERVLGRVWPASSGPSLPERASGRDAASTPAERRREEGAGESLGALRGRSGALPEGKRGRGKSPEAAPAMAKPKSSPEVLRRLNRAQEEREREPAATKGASDPFGYPR